MTASVGLRRPEERHKDIHHGRELVRLGEVELVRLLRKDPRAERVLVQRLLLAVVREQRDHRGNGVVSDADMERRAARNVALSRHAALLPLPCRSESSSAGSARSAWE